MGCGSSKLGPEEEAEPPGLHPFRRRINEILQRRNGRSIKDTTPSTKKPLLDEAEDTNSSPTDSLLDDCLKSKSSPESVVSAKGQPPPENDVKEVQEVVKDIEEVQEVSTVKDVVKEVQELSMQEMDVKEVQEVSTPEKDVNEVPRSDKTTGALAGEQKEREGENVGVKEEDEGEEDDDNDDDDEEDERGSFDGEGAEFAPGSPSFRVYYVPSDDELGEAANGEGEWATLPKFSIEYSGWAGTSSGLNFRAQSKVGSNVVRPYLSPKALPWPNSYYLLHHDNINKNIYITIIRVRSYKTFYYINFIVKFLAQSSLSLSLLGPS